MTSEKFKQWQRDFEKTKKRLRHESDMRAFAHGITAYLLLGAVALGVALLLF